MRHQPSQMLIFGVAVSLICSDGYQDCNRRAYADDKATQKHIAIPSSALLGKPLGETKAFGPKTTSVVYPESVQFDLDENVVYGLIAVYPEGITFSQLLDAVNENHRKWWRDADGEMSKYGVSVWRNEDARVAIQISGSQVVMIWLDRRVTDQEKNAVSNALHKIESANDKKGAKSKKPAPTNN